MKRIIINIIFLFSGIVCFSQTISSDPIIKTFGKEQLKDCQAFDQYQYPKGNDISILFHSYEFDEKGNIIKEIKSPKGDDTGLVISAYDSASRIINNINYWNRRSGKMDTSSTVYSYNKKNQIDSILTYSYWDLKLQNDFKFLYIVFAKQLS